MAFHCSVANCQRDRSTGKKNSSTSVCKTSNVRQFLDGDTLERCA